MTAAHKLTCQQYGKAQIRLSHIKRDEDQHYFNELTIDIALDGTFEHAYTRGDNAKVIPTDTMKNTVYAMAKSKGFSSCEDFALKLSAHFLDSFNHVNAADVTIHEQLWNRMTKSADGSPHPFAFIGGSQERNTCEVRGTRDGTTLRSGIDGLKVLKTTESAFAGFLQDGYTTLAETHDRIFATTVTASWACPDQTQDWTRLRQNVRECMLDVFANRFSPSVQKTLYEMAQAVFASCTLIDEISISMPNQHHLLVNLAPFGLDNNNEVFVPTAEPFGVISATVARQEGQS